MRECTVNAAQGAWTCGVLVAEHWLELNVGMKLHPHLGGNDAVAVLNSSPQLQLLQLPPQVLTVLLLLLFPGEWKQKETQRGGDCFNPGDIHVQCHSKPKG